MEEALRDAPELAGRPVRVRVDGRVAIRFEGLPEVPEYARVDAVRPTGDVATDFEFLVTLKRIFEAILAGLPLDSLGYEDFFGDLPPKRVFQDNCHLTVEGSKLVGRRMAEVALARTRGR